VRRTAFLVAKRALYPGVDVATRERLRFVRHFTPGPIRTLDVGCGNGVFSLAAYRLGNRVLGVDLNPDNVARSREYADFVGADPARLRFEVLDAYHLDSYGERFDQVIAFEILEHLAADREAVACFGRLLEPGGSLHVSSPYLHRKPYAGEVLTDREDGGHLRLGYTFEQLEEIMRGAALTPVGRDTAVGPVSRALLETVNRVEARLGRAAAVATWCAGAPVAATERLVRRGSPSLGRALIVYVQARKPWSGSSHDAGEPAQARPGELRD
jgi:SAM-dependent methyltransferase